MIFFDINKKCRKLNFRKQIIDYFGNTLQYACTIDTIDTYNVFLLAKEILSSSFDVLESLKITQYIIK